MTNVNELIDGILKREGRFVKNPADRGGRTDYGISEAAHPAAWADNQVTEQEARDIYLQRYYLQPGFDKISYQPLRTQLVDFGVNSGTGLATQKLQTILGVKADGKIGPLTLEALEVADQREVNNQLVAERVKMFGRIVTRDRSQLVFLNGWLNRALEFLL